MDKFLPSMSGHEDDSDDRVGSDKPISQFILKKGKHQDVLTGGAEYAHGKDSSDVGSDDDGSGDDGDGSEDSESNNSGDDDGGDGSEDSESNNSGDDDNGTSSDENESFEEEVNGDKKKKVVKDVGKSVVRGMVGRPKVKAVKKVVKAVSRVSGKRQKVEAIEVVSKAVARGSRKRRNIEVVTVEDDDEESPGKTLNQRISPKLFMDFVKKMPETHKEAVRNIGFGGLLELDIGKHHSHFAKKVVCLLDADRCSFVLPCGKEIKLSKKDVKAVYGLPCGGNLVEEGHENDDGSSDRWVDFVEEWRSSYNLTMGGPSNAAVFKKLDDFKSKPVCDAFLFNFLVAAVNCCVKSTTSGHSFHKFLYSCMDVNEISKLDWCKYVYNSLFETVRKYNGGKGKSFFTGPLPFVLICYCDRLQRGFFVKPRTVPLTSVWKEDMMSKRIRLEYESGFGNGIVLSTSKGEGDVLEGCEEKEKRKEEKKKIKEEKKKNKEAKKRTTQEEVSRGNFMNNFKALAKKLANDVTEISKVLAIAGEVFEGNELADQMNNLIENIWGKYRISKEVRISQRSQHSEPATERGYSSLLSQSDNEFFNEPGFLEELELVCANYDIVKEDVGGKGMRKRKGVINDELGADKDDIGKDKENTSGVDVSGDVGDGFAHGDSVPFDETVRADVPVSVGDDSVEGHDDTLSDVELLNSVSAQQKYRTSDTYKSWGGLIYKRRRIAGGDDKEEEVKKDDKKEKEDEEREKDERRRKEDEEERRKEEELDKERKMKDEADKLKKKKIVEEEEEESNLKDIPTKNEQKDIPGGDVEGLKSKLGSCNNVDDYEMARVLLRLRG